MLADPEFRRKGRERHATKMRATWRDPVRGKKLRNRKQSWSEKRKAQQRERLAQRMADPEFQRNRLAALATPECRAKRLAGLRKANAVRCTPPPAGYEGVYRELRRRHKIPAAESLRIVRAQRGADLRAR